MIALITRINSPNERMINGNHMIFRIGLTTAFSTPRIVPPTRYSWDVPLEMMPAPASASYGKK